MTSTLRLSTRMAMAAIVLSLALPFEAEACDLCRKIYLETLERTPKASALHPGAKIVEYELQVAEETLSPAGNPVRALTLNGGTPGPVLRFREGDVARIKVVNRLTDQSTSIHWHGLLVPNLEDGVPHVTTPPIEPGTSRTYEFLIRQHGTYWYHSHTGHQKQRGVFGAIVIEPKVPGLGAARDEVIVLSDWTDESPTEVQRTLLRGSEWYAFRKGTSQSLLGAWRAGRIGDYLDSQKALVPPMDLSDVAFEAFLMNGKRELRLPGRPGEKTRLRVINASAATYFYLDSAAGPLHVVAGDGQDVTPFDQKRLLIGPAETYDIVLTMPAAGSWEVRSTAQDGSGHVSAWVGEGVPHAAVPPPRPDRYGMNAYLTSILDQLDPEPGAPESERPLSPYRKMRAAVKAPQAAKPREITLKLTGDMIRYAWSFDGVDPESAESIRVKQGETVRLRLVNNSMMHHPIHLHGHFFRLVDADDPDPRTAPLKHTVDVPPMSVRTIEFTADEGRGDWLIHCHLLYHHITGMVRTIRVTAADGSEPPHPAGTHAMPSTYAWGQVAVTNAHAVGFVTVQSGPHNLFLRWDEGLHTGDWYEREAYYQRYMNTRLALVAGYRWDTSPGGRESVFAGAALRLPYFFELTLTQQAGGETRAELAKSLQLTDRLSLDLALRHGRNSDTFSSADFRFLLNKTFSLTAGYSSDFGAGAGIIARF